MNQTYFMKVNNYMLSILLGLLMSGCSSFNIVKKPVTFDENRAKLSLQYLQEDEGQT